MKIVTDLFAMNWVGPDHVVIGNVRYVLYALFKSIRTEKERRRLSTFFYVSMKNNKHVVEKSAFNIRRTEPNNTSFTITLLIFRSPEQSWNNWLPQPERRTQHSKGTVMY